VDTATRLAYDEQQGSETPAFVEERARQRRAAEAHALERRKERSQVDVAIHDPDSARHARPEIHSARAERVTRLDPPETEPRSRRASEHGPGGEPSGLKRIDRGRVNVATPEPPEPPLPESVVRRVRRLTNAQSPRVHGPEDAAAAREAQGHQTVTRPAAGEAPDQRERQREQTVTRFAADERHDQRREQTVTRPAEGGHPRQHEQTVIRPATDHRMERQTSETVLRPAVDDRLERQSSQTVIRAAADDRLERQSSQTVIRAAADERLERPTSPTVPAEGERPARRPSAIRQAVAAPSEHEGRETVIRPALDEDPELARLQSERTVMFQAHDDDDSPEGRLRAIRARRAARDPNA
jgi:hypothetical protein